MKTENLALESAHATVRQAIYYIRATHGLPADDYNTIYRLLNEALSHIETRQGGSTTPAYFSHELQA